MPLELVNRLPYNHPYRWDGRPFGGPRLWRPDQLGSSLVLWLDAEDTASIILNGSDVSQWNDKSGNGNHVSNATAATQPAYLTTGWNGKPTVNFTFAGQEFLHKSGVSNFTPTSDFTIASAFEFLETSKSWDMIVGWRSFPQNNSSADNGVPILQGLSGNQQIGFHYTDIQDIRIKVDVTTRLGKKIATISRSGGNNGNGGAATVTSTGFSQATYETNATQSWPSASSTGFQVGGKQQVGTDWGNKYISEVVGCNTKLSTADRQRLEGYLAWKWGLEANLPSDHPYRFSLPTVEEAGFDADALAYIGRVQSSDNAALEPTVRKAYNDFVVGCKADGIWNAIKSSAILAGARTLTGALQPLSGTAPTNFNFVSGDYNRKTGLVGDESTKYLNSNRNNNADPQNNQHMSVWASTAATSTASTFPIYIGAGALGNGVSHIGRLSSNGPLYIRNRNNTYQELLPGSAVGLLGMSRSSSDSYVSRVAGVSANQNVTSQTPFDQSIFVFAASSDPGRPSNARLSYYSIGESLDLALLDARVTTLMNQINGAIP